MLRIVALACCLLVAGHSVSAPARELPSAGTPAASLLRSAPPTRIAFGSCADQTLPQPFWEPILATEPDLFLMLGDNVYGDVTSAEMRELEAAYAALAREPSFRRLRAAVPVMATWDDHDYGKNDGGADFVHRERAESLFRAFWGVPAESPRARRPGVYDAAVFGPPGRRVQIILLDTRFFRSPLLPTDEPGARGKERYLPDPDPGKTMLGAAQWAWLARELARPAELRLIVSSIQVLADGHGWERWGNLPRERERLFEVIAKSGAGGVVLLSGDRHFGAIYRRDDLLSYPVYEVTSSSLNRPYRDAHEPGPHRIRDIYGEENFGLARIDWKARHLTLELRALDGQAVRSLRIGLDDLAPPP